MNKAMELLRRVFTLQQEQEQQGGIEFIIDPIEPSELPEGCRPDLPRLEPTFSTPVYNAELSEAMERSANQEPTYNFQATWTDLEQFGKVWIYNVSELPHTIHGSTIKTLNVPACEEGKEYSVATSLPIAFRQPKHFIEANEMYFAMEDGRRVAQDLINPSNMGLDQDQDTEQRYSMAVGCNYNQKGVFWSTHNPPLKKELKAAHKRLKAYYENILDVANLERVTAAAKRLNIPTYVVNAADKYLD